MARRSSSASCSRVWSSWTVRGTSTSFLAAVRALDLRSDQPERAQHLPGIRQRANHDPLRADRVDRVGKPHEASVEIEFAGLFNLTSLHMNVIDFRWRLTDSVRF